MTEFDDRRKDSVTRRVLRYVVPVDDRWHRIELAKGAEPVHVDCRQPDLVEFWTNDPVERHNIHDGTGRLISAKYGAVSWRPRAWEFRVMGTGQSIDDGEYVGTALAASGALVWHLFRREVPL